MRSYVDAFLPGGSNPAPAMVLSHLLLHRGLAALYDKPLLIEVIQSLGLVDVEFETAETGVLTVYASRN